MTKKVKNDVTAGSFCVPPYHSDGKYNSTLEERIKRTPKENAIRGMWTEENFRECDIKCAEIWSREKYEGKSRWTPSDVKQWRKENGYPWHERNDMVICDLVPTKIKRFFGHLGGVSECKKCRMV